jgi:tRNA threonylcarbamoyladenosine biosynthesis protein TsaE
MQGELEIKMLARDDAANAALSLLNFAGERKIFLFEGPMGSGKTTIIKEIAKQLKSTDHFSSPTYSLVNEYAYPGGKIFHFDLYRLKNFEELLDLGIEEQLYSGSYCLIEWPALTMDLIHSNYVEVELRAAGEERWLRAANQ